MWKDPIVEEIRNVRDAHAAQYNYDLKEIYQAIKKEEAMSGRKFTKLTPKRLDAGEVGAAEA